MAIKRQLSPPLGTQIYRSDKTKSKDSTDYNFRLQTTPPLSLQQYARAHLPLSGAPRWQYTGTYRPPSFQLYFSPESRKKPIDSIVKPWVYSYQRKNSIPTYSLKYYKDTKPKPPEPIWRPTGPYRSKRPTSLSPEKRWQELIHEPIWQPNGSLKYGNPPYFDPPSLRWTYKQILRSLPNIYANRTRSPSKVCTKTEMTTTTNQ